MHRLIVRRDFSGWLPDIVRVGAPLTRSWVIRRLSPGPLDHMVMQHTPSEDE